MRAHWLAAAVSLLSALLARPARAQEHVGEKGQFILSADRLVPVIAHDAVSIDNTTTRTTTTAFFTSGAGFNVHNVPRVGFDFLVTNGLTLGGNAIAFFTFGSSSTFERNGVSVEVDTPGLTILGIAPRIGYIVPLGKHFAFWPRGGLSLYYQRSSANGNRPDLTQKATLLSLDIDPQFVITPVQHFGITLGVLGAIPLTGSNTRQIENGNVVVTSDQDLSVFHLGINAGLLGYF